MAPHLPHEVRDLAVRLGVPPLGALSAVTLQQQGTLRDSPAHAERQFRAVQTISLRGPEFAWRARIGRFGLISVLDSLSAVDAFVAVGVFGLLRIAGARGGPCLVKGEIMRYLAELAWAPDAILCNPALTWTVEGERAFRVAAGHGPARGEVELRLDDNGCIGEVRAEDRPRKEGSGFNERPWRGRFFDYRKHEGRLLPFGGEVGWIIGGESFVAWRGRLRSWAIC